MVLKPASYIQDGQRGSITNNTFKIRKHFHTRPISFKIVNQYTILQLYFYLNKEYKVFERGVEVRLLAQLHHLGEVLVVDVRVHAEQTLQDRLRHRQEVLGERHT